MGVSDETAKKYVPEDAPLGELWIFMAKVFWESRTSPAVQETYEKLPKSQS
jgi:hypothetical protein